MTKVVFQDVGFQFNAGPETVRIPVTRTTVNTCIAASQSNLKKLKQAGITPESDDKNIVLIFPNEPRNKKVVRSMLQTVKNNWRVVIWPEHLSAKTLAEMVAKKNIDRLAELIDANVFRGFRASIAIMSWKRC